MQYEVHYNLVNMTASSTEVT